MREDLESIRILHDRQAAVLVVTMVDIGVAIATHIHTYMQLINNTIIIIIIIIIHSIIL